jgi:hypothetical protein
MIRGHIKSRRMTWTGHASRMRDMRNEYKIYVVKSEGKRPPWIPGNRYEDNIEMDPKEVRLKSGFLNAF